MYKQENIFIMMKKICTILVIFSLGYGIVMPACAQAKEMTTEMIGLFEHISREHQELAEDLQQFFTELCVNQKSHDMEDVWERYTALALSLVNLKQKEEIILKDIQGFSRKYFAFCLAIDKVTDRHEIPSLLSARLGDISDTLKDIAELLDN